MPSYPITLPAPLVESYSIAPLEQTIRTDMESGAARVRRRTVARNDLVDVAFAMTDEQFVDFRSWFDDPVAGLSGGASWFDMALPLGNGGSTPEEARFKSAWKAARDGLIWKVTAQLEVR